jgi:hypothetical protein
MHSGMGNFIADSKIWHPADSSLILIGNYCNLSIENSIVIEKKGVDPAHLMSGIASTDSGLARAEMSPVGLPRALAFITRRIILPDLVLGTSLTK